MNRVETSNPIILDYQSGTRRSHQFVLIAKWIYKFAPALIAAAAALCVIAGVILGIGKGDHGIIMVIPVYFFGPLYVVFRVLTHRSSTIVRCVLGMLAVACVLLAPFVLSTNPIQRYSVAWLVVNVGWSSSWVDDADRIRIIILVGALTAFALIRISELVMRSWDNLASRRARNIIDGGAL